MSAVNDFIRRHIAAYCCGFFTAFAVFIAAEAFEVNLCASVLPLC